MDSGFMQIEDVVAWMLKRPSLYKGLHNKPQPRTTPSCMPLEPQAQMMIIFKATMEYLKEKLLDGKSINVKGLGMFTFEIRTDLPRLASKEISTTKTLTDQRKERKHVHGLRPCFVVDPALKECLKRYPGKEEVEKPKSQHSVYQQGFNVNFCNPVPIAAACFLGKNLVKDTLTALWASIRDLIQIHERDLELKMDFCKLVIQNSNMKMIYNPQFIETLNSHDFEEKMRKSDTTTSEHWKQSTYKSDTDKIGKVMTLKPQTANVKALGNKTQALKLMSLDMASSAPGTTGPEVLKIE